MIFLIDYAQYFYFYLCMVTWRCETVKKYEKIKRGIKKKSQSN